MLWDITRLISICGPAVFLPSCQFIALALTREQHPRCTIPRTEQDTIQVPSPRVTKSQIFSSHNSPPHPHQLCQAGEQSGEELRFRHAPATGVGRRHKQRDESRKKTPGEAPIVGFLVPPEWPAKDKKWVFGRRTTLLAHGGPATEAATAIQALRLDQF